MIAGSPESVSLATRLRLVLQSVVSLSAVVYATGFLVANSYYATFGITEYQLINTKYVAAGLNYLSTHVLLATVIAGVMFLIGRAIALVLLSTSLATWLLLGIFCHPSESTSAIKALALVGLNTAVIELLGYQIWSRWGARHRVLSGILSGIRLPPRNYLTLLASRDIPEEVLAVIVGIGSLLLVISSLVTWGRYCWPSQAPMIGGGRPDQAIFVLDSESLPAGGLPYIPMQTNVVTEQLHVLFETPDSYVVLTKLDSGSSVAVKLARSSVVSVHFARSVGLGGRKLTLPTLTPVPTLTPTVTATPSSET